MGYTHYYKQTRDFTREEWQEIKTAFRLMLSQLPEHTNTAGGYYKDSPLLIGGWDGKGKPKITNDEISFNGSGFNDVDLSHETFLLVRRGEKYAKDTHSEYMINDDGVFFFCKTARKPYDLLVCALLLAVSEIAPAALSISSDGDMRGQDWKPARKFLQTMKIPIAK